MVAYSQISWSQPSSFLPKGQWLYHFSSRSHTNQRPGTHDPALWPFIKSELPIGLIQGQRLLTAAAELRNGGPCLPESRTPGASQGSALPGAAQAVTRVSLPPAASLRPSPRAHRAPARPFKLASVRLPGSPDHSRATWAQSRGRASVPRCPACEWTPSYARWPDPPLCTGAPTLACSSPLPPSILPGSGYTA